MITNIMTSGILIPECQYTVCESGVRDGCGHGLEEEVGGGVEQAPCLNAPLLEVGRER